jgi:hypothetical protein
VKEAGTNHAESVSNALVYAGYSYRRVLANDCHSSTLQSSFVSPSDFQTTWLNPLNYNDGRRESIEVFPDPWCTHRGTAFAVAREEYSEQANKEVSEHGGGGGDVKKDYRFQLLDSERLYLPV